jgi:hypothetical protein
MEQITTLELQIISAKHLKDVNLIGKMDVYVVVSLSDGVATSDQKTKTTVDRDGGTNPTWDFPVKFTVKDSKLDRLTLVFKLKCDRTIGGDRVIGEVNVPVKDILDSTKQQFVSYQVRKPSGRPQGFLNFSYRVIGPSINGCNGLTGPSQQEEDHRVTTEKPRDALHISYKVSENQVSKLYPVIGRVSEAFNGESYKVSEGQVSKLVSAYPVIEPSNEVFVGPNGPPGPYYPPPPRYTYPPPPQPIVYGGYHQAPLEYGYPPPPGYGYISQGVYAYSNLGRY